MPRARGASTRATELIDSSGGGAGGMAATIDISTDCARACARALTDAVADDTAPAAPELLMAMYAGAALAGVAAGTADAGGAGGTSRERATPLSAAADGSRPGCMPPVASSC